MREPRSLVPGTYEHDRKDIEMLWLIGGIALVLVSFSATLGGLGTGLLMLAGIASLLLAFRLEPAGAMVAELSRRRFE